MESLAAMDEAGEVEGEGDELRLEGKEQRLNSEN
jgi:hypothetical protein